MKILVVAMTRCGGMCFTEWLAKELEYTFVTEPVNDNYIPNQNEVVKILIQSLNPIVLPYYDKIIGLRREDFMEYAISMERCNELGKMHNPYTIPENWIELNYYALKQWKKHGEVTHNNILNLKEVELQVTYEGIFNTKKDINKVKKYIGIKELKHKGFIDKRYRLRY
jgi:hypothetical protein